VLEIAAVLALVLASAALAAGAWLGAFARIRVEERVAGPHRFVYRTLRGTSPREVGRITDEVAAALRAAGAKPVQPLDLYYPQGSGNENEIGWTVDDTDAARVAAPGAALVQRTLPAEPAMTVRFPWQHPLSYAVGALRVIPALRAHRELHDYQDGPSYTLHEGDTILYVQPIRR